ncbi:hypothetical protein ACWGCW_40850 [Streptomyces sp. NPDC054933]
MRLVIGIHDQPQDATHVQTAALSRPIVGVQLHPGESGPGPVM